MVPLIMHKYFQIPLDLEMPMKLSIHRIKVIDRLSPRLKISFTLIFCL